MSNVKELLDEAIYAGNLSENEEEKLYSWIESLILAKRKADEHEAKAKAWDRVYEAFEKAENEHEFSNGVCTVMNEYESGGLDV